MVQLRVILATMFGAVVLAAPSFAEAPLFAAETPIAFTLEAPFARIASRARVSRDPWPGVLRLTEGGTAQVFPVQINPRGVSRRVGGFCTFPPLALTFDEAGVRNTLFAGQGRLKLVSVCQPTSQEYEQYLVREYLAYRLYNVLSPMSFRVRAADVTYDDTQSGRENRPRFAFVIEGVDDMAKRNGRKELEVETFGADYNQFDPQAMTRVAMFQFMIGNLDWDFIGGVRGEKCCHNMKLLVAPNATTNIVPAPYDFDYSGFVGTPYAVPPDDIPVRSVRTRYFRGLCRFKDELPAAIAFFRTKRAELTAVIAGETRLDEGNRREAGAYIDAFFSVLDNPPQANRAFTGRCDS